MIAATVDVNVLVSALINPLGAPQRVIHAWQAGRFTHVTSDHIIATLEAELYDPDLLRRFPFLPTAGHALLPLLRTQAAIVAVLAPAIVPVTGDPEDDAVLATARLGRVNYLVTGDRTLRDLGIYQGIRILTPQALMELLEQDGRP